MKATGIVRNIGKVGSIKIPQKIVSSLGPNPRRELIFFVNGESIIIEKYEPECTFYNGVSNIKYFNEKPICENCIEEFRGL